VERGAGVVADPQEEHLPVQVVHTAHRAPGSVRRERQRAGGDLLRPRPGRREGERMVAPHHPGEPPEGIGDDPQVRRGRGARRVEGLVVAPRPGGHHQGAAEAQGVVQGLDQAERSSLHRPDGAEGGMYEQDPALLHAERAELGRHLGPVHAASSAMAAARRAAAGGMRPSGSASGS
jgi:hypothetical protein